MRSTFCTFSLIISICAFSEDFTVFEKDGYFGIKDEAGLVTVPAVYEELGWTSGERNVFEGLIGYKKGNSWGLITVRNKSLTGQKFYTLEPFKEGYIKGSLKGKFSNHLFYGLLDLKGETAVNFNYFEIQYLGDDLLVSELERGKRLFGLVSLDNEILIPLKYSKISKQHSFFLASTFKQSIDIYYENSLIQSALDSAIYSDGLIGYRAGYAGYMNKNGKLVSDFIYKSIELEGNNVKNTEFPIWKVYKSLDFEFEWKCDSINYSKSGVWVAHLNGAQHIVLPESKKFDSKEYLIDKIEKDFIIVKSSKTRKFSIINMIGEELIGGYDSITYCQTHFLGMKKDKWFIINSSGTRLHKLPYNYIAPGPNNFFIAYRNKHWGVVDFNGDEYLTFKYDSVIHTSNHYQVKYFDKWGILDFHGNWIVQPEYEEIQSFGEVAIARKGLGYSIFHNNNFKFRTTGRPLYASNKNILMEGDSGKVGMLNNFGDLVADPIYDEIRFWGDFVELQMNGFSKLMTYSGKLIFDISEEIQEVGGFTESHFSVRKNNRWGFIDVSGNLRISNRYDSVHLFSEGMAAIKLRGKWGFINKEESIAVQPYYDNVSTFRNGLSIVKKKELSGIITKNGTAVVEVSYAEIERLSTGNYRLRDRNGKYGLVNSEGRFLIRPSFDFLNDTNQGIIVMNENKWGLLDYDGSQLFKLESSFMQVVENFVLLKI